MSCVTYEIPLGHVMPTGIDGGACAKPIALSAGTRRRVVWTGVPALFAGPNGTKQGMAFAASEPRGASG
jgi:hypothetical protein